MKKLIKNCLLLFEKKEKKIALLIFFNSFIISIFEIIGIGIIPVFISFLINPDKFVNTDLYFFNFIKSFDLLKYNSIIALSSAIIIFFIFKNIYSIFSIYLQENFFKKVRISIVEKLLKNYTKKDYNFFLNINSTVLIRNILNESIISVSFLTIFLNFSREFILTIFILILLTILEPLVILSIIFLVSICLFIYFIVTRQRIKNMSIKAREFRSHLLKDLNHLFGSIKLVKVLNRESFFSKAFLKKFSESEKLRIFIVFFTRFPRHIVEILVVGMLLSLLILMTEFSNKEFIEIIPILAFFTMCALRLMPAINVITASYPTLRTNYTSLNFVAQDLLEYKKLQNLSNISEKKNYYNIAKGKNINLVDVCYSYKNSEKIFDRVSLSLPIGESIAVMGESGAGKSTLMDLLMGLQKPQEGKILYDNQDIFISTKDWQRNFGYIPQNVNLIDETIQNNVAFGIDEDKINIGKVIDSIKRSQLEKLIDTSEKGLDTIIGERGSRISGGQIQRIGIARALYNDPKILIFDESTNSLDKKTEEKLLNDIFKLKENYSIIIITHDLSIAERCNIIYQIKDKKITLLKKTK